MLLQIIFDQLATVH